MWRRVIFFIAAVLNMTMGFFFGYQAFLTIWTPNCLYMFMMTIMCFYFSARCISNLTGVQEVEPAIDAMNANPAHIELREFNIANHPFPPLEDVHVAEDQNEAAVRRFEVLDVLQFLEFEVEEEEEERHNPETGG